MNWSSDIKKNNELDIAREHFSHIIRLQSIKPRIDMTNPKKMVHLQSKSKATVTKEHKNQIVQSENQLLLQKMLEIRSRSQKQTIPTSFSVKSLNFNTRATLSSKITEENLKMLTRLEAIKSNYSCKK